MFTACRRRGTENGQCGEWRLKRASILLIAIPTAFGKRLKLYLMTEVAYNILALRFYCDKSYPEKSHADFSTLFREILFYESSFIKRRRIMRYFGRLFFYKAARQLLLIIRR
jgi:hypothetical protein